MLKNWIKLKAIAAVLALRKWHYPFAQIKGFYRVFAKNYFRSFQGIFFGFLLPLFLMLIFYFLKLSPDSAGQSAMMSGYVLLSPLTIGLVGLASAIAEWKESILLKRIDATPVKKWMFMFSLLTFFTLISLAGVIWMMLWGLFVVGVDPDNTIKQAFGNINAGWFIASVLIIAILSISVGILIGGLVSNAAMAQAISLCVYFPSAFLSGIMFPPQLIDGVDVLRYITYILPHKYASFTNLIAWNNGSMPSDWGQGYTEFTAIWEPPVIAVCWIIAINAVNMFTFRLTSVNR